VMQLVDTDVPVRPPICCGSGYGVRQVGSTVVELKSKGVSKCERDVESLTK
jgi:hypothetical protein